MANYEAFIERRSINDGQLVVETTPIDAQILFQTRQRSSQIKQHRVGPLLRAQVIAPDLNIFGRKQTDFRAVDISAEKRQGSIDLSPTESLVVREQTGVEAIVVYDVTQARVNQRQARLINNQ